jgi:hypothetical protein
MKPRLTTSAVSLALKIYEVATASLGLLVGVYMARGLIRRANGCQRVLRRRRIAANLRMRMLTHELVASRRADLAVPGARSARLQHPEKQEGREDSGVLQVFAVKRIGFACDAKIGCSLVSVQPTG